MESSTFSIKEAYKICEQITRSNYENFPIATFLLPRAIKPHFYAIYAFCRKTDDIGDEEIGNRLEILDSWEAQLTATEIPNKDDPILVALKDTIKRFEIPIDPFLKLIEANRMDQQHVRFRTFSELEGYCENSANSVGEMVLYVTGNYSPENLLLSDSTCTALQITNFLQDIKRDFLVNRIYIPLEDMVKFKYSEEDLRNNLVNDQFREMMAFEVSRTKSLFEHGYNLVDRINGRFKLDIALFNRGGLSILKAIENQNFDVITKRPTLSSKDKFKLLTTSLLRLVSSRRP